MSRGLRPLLFFSFCLAPLAWPAHASGSALRRGCQCDVHAPMSIAPQWSPVKEGAQRTETDKWDSGEGGACAQTFTAKERSKRWKRWFPNETQRSTGRLQRPGGASGTCSNDHPVKDLPACRPYKARARREGRKEGRREGGGEGQKVFFLGRSRKVFASISLSKRPFSACCSEPEQPTS